MGKSREGAALILVIDEVELVRRTVGRMLQSRHHRVLLARNELEGLDLCRDQEPDLVIMDIDGTKSLGLLRQFRILVPGVPFIAMSATDSPAEDLLGGALRSGAVAAMAKPFHLLELIQIVNGVLARGRGEWRPPGDSRKATMIHPSYSITWQGQTFHFERVHPKVSGTGISHWAIIRNGEFIGMMACSEDATSEEFEARGLRWLRDLGDAALART